MSSSKPEERTFKIEHKGKGYLVQLRSDKGLWITDAEAQDIVNTFNVESFQNEALLQAKEALIKEVESQRRGKLFYSFAAFALLCYSIFRVVMP